MAPQLSPSDSATGTNKDQISHARSHGRWHRRPCQAPDGSQFRPPDLAGRGRRIKRPRLTRLSVRSSPTIRWTVASFRGDASRRERRFSPTLTVIHWHCAAVSRRGMRITTKVDPLLDRNSINKSAGNLRHNNFVETDRQPFTYISVTHMCHF